MGHTRESSLFSGWLARISQAATSDFLLGLGLAGLREFLPGPFATNLDDRPVIGEDDALNVEPWPGRVSRYTDDGRFITANRRDYGQNIFLGLALSFAEVRAFVMGLAQARDGGPRLAREFYRCAQGLGNVLAEIAALGGFSLATYQEAFRQLFFSSGPYIIARITTDADTGDAIKRLPTGEVAVCQGDALSSGDLLIGCSVHKVQAQSLALVGKTGAFIRMSSLPPGRVFRAASGKPVPYSQLPAQAETNRLGVSSALGLDVDIGDGEQVPGPPSP